MNQDLGSVDALEEVASFLEVLSAAMRREEKLLPDGKVAYVRPWAWGTGQIVTEWPGEPCYIAQYWYGTVAWAVKALRAWEPLRDEPEPAGWFRANTPGREERRRFLFTGAGEACLINGRFEFFPYVEPDAAPPDRGCPADAHLLLAAPDKKDYWRVSPLSDVRWAWGPPRRGALVEIVSRRMWLGRWPCSCRWAPRWRCSSCCCPPCGRSARWSGACR